MKHETAEYAPPSKAKNRFNGLYLYCGECQRIMTFCQRKEYSFLSPAKQRIRDSFAEATESREIFRELGKVVNPSDTVGFTAQKKPVG